MIRLTVKEAKQLKQGDKLLVYSHGKFLIRAFECCGSFKYNVLETDTKYPSTSHVKYLSKNPWASIVVGYEHPIARIKSIERIPINFFLSAGNLAVFKLNKREIDVLTISSALSGEISYNDVLTLVWEKSLMPSQP